MIKYFLILSLMLTNCSLTKSPNDLLKEQNDLLELEGINILAQLEKRTIISSNKYSNLKEIGNEILTKTLNLKQTIKSNADINLIREAVVNHFQYLLDFGFLDKSNHNYIKGYENIILNYLSQNQKIDAETKECLLIGLNNVQNNVLNQVLFHNNKHDFSFNKIYPIIIEESKMLKPGDTYKAKILMAAIDTMIVPQVFVGEQLIPMNNNYEGILNIKTKQKGTFSWQGRFEYLNEKTGRIVEFSISSNYEVK